MFLSHYKGVSSAKTIMDLMLESSGKPYIVIGQTATPADVEEAYRQAADGTIVVIEDVDAIEPSRLKAIFDRLERIK